MTREEKTAIRDLQDEVAFAGDFIRCAQLAAQQACKNRPEMSAIVETIEIGLDRLREVKEGLDGLVNPGEEAADGEAA